MYPFSSNPILTAQRCGLRTGAKQSISVPDQKFSDVWKTQFLALQMRETESFSEKFMGEYLSDGPLQHPSCLSDEIIIDRWR